MQANGSKLATLEYLDLDFKLVDEDVAVFDGKIELNGKMVTERQFEWRPATLSHMILQAIEDEPVTDIVLKDFMHPTAVTNEAFSVLSKLNKPTTGFEKLEVQFNKLEEKMSSTVVDQFALHCQHLQQLTMSGYYLEEDQDQDRLNNIDLIVRILDAQTNDKMKVLKIYGFYNRVNIDEVTEEDR